MTPRPTILFDYVNGLTRLVSQPWPGESGLGRVYGHQWRYFGVSITRYPNVAADGEKGPRVYNTVVRLGRRRKLKVVYK